MTLYDLKKGSEIESIDLPLSLVLGTFDGIHLGHTELIGSAKAKKDPICVFTFSENPFSVPYIITLEEKLSILAQEDVDYCAVYDFDEIRNMPWQSFVRDILVDKLNVKTAVCGFNFRFGAKAEGTAEKLKETLETYGAQTLIIPPFTQNGEVVSSSRIRALLIEGKVDEAALLLGRNYSLVYNVCHGNGIGTGFGFPTINTPYSEGSVPLAAGVYICSCMGHPAVTNFGVRPTVTNENIPVFETFILDYNKDLYEQRVRVEFLKMLRPEYKFDSRQALVEQISRDVEAVRNYFKNK